MFDRAVLESLLVGLETATSGDRALDAAITVAFFSDVVALADQHSEADSYWLHIGGGMSLHSSEPMTSSVDAALALFDQVLPTAFIRIDRAGDRPNEAIWRCEIDTTAASGRAPTAPLAILLALFRALLEAND